MLGIASSAFCHLPLDSIYGLYPQQWPLLTFNHTFSVKPLAFINSHTMFRFSQIFTSTLYVHLYRMHTHTQWDMHLHINIADIHTQAHVDLSRLIHVQYTHFCRNGPCQTCCCGKKITGGPIQMTLLNPSHKTPDGSLPGVEDKGVADITLTIGHARGVGIGSGGCIWRRLFYSIHAHKGAPSLDNKLTIHPSDRKDPTPILKHHDQSWAHSLSLSEWECRKESAASKDSCDWCIALSEVSAHTGKKALAIHRITVANFYLLIPFLLSPVMHFFLYSAHPVLLRSLLCVQKGRSTHGITFYSDYNSVKVLLLSYTLKHKLGITSEECLDEPQQRNHLFDGCCTIYQDVLTCKHPAHSQCEYVRK